MQKKLGLELVYMLVGQLCGKIITTESKQLNSSLILKK
jgi:hypothetical protein